MCIDIMVVWFGIANGQSHQFLTVIYLPHDSGWVLSFQVFIFFSKLNSRDVEEDWKQPLREVFIGFTVIS